MIHRYQKPELKVERPRSRKTAEQTEGGNGSGGIGYKSKSPGRSHSPNPGDDNSIGGESFDGVGDRGGDDNDNLIDSEDAMDDESPLVLSRRCDRLLLDALVTCEFEQRKVRVKLDMTFNCATGIAKRASGNGKNLMKFVDDLNKRQIYSETIDFEAQDNLRALGHICKNLYRTGKTMLEGPTVTGKRVQKAMGAIKHKTRCVYSMHL